MLTSFLRRGYAMGSPGNETIVGLTHVNSVICVIAHLKKQSNSNILLLKYLNKFIGKLNVQRVLKVTLIQKIIR
jgi:hypothetical protein